jgi:hypothetical protein
MYQKLIKTFFANLDKFNKIVSKHNSCKFVYKTLTVALRYDRTLIFSDNISAQPIKIFISDPLSYFISANKSVTTPEQDKYIEDFVNTFKPVNEKTKEKAKETSKETNSNIKL